MLDFFTSSTFFFIMGILTVFVAMGANAWFTEKGFIMNWWKWLLTATWYLLLNVTIAAPFTLFAEREAKAAWATLGIFGVITIILGVGLWRILTPGTEGQPSTNS